MAYTLMIVDDSSVVRAMIKKVLGLTNLELNPLIQAENGQEALNQLQDNWVDLIFLDINMPIMNGIDFMEKLRQDDTYKTTPVIIVSTEGSQERLKKLEDLKIESYLRKPVTPEGITEAVTKALQGK